MAETDRHDRLFAEPPGDRGFDVAPLVLVCRLGDRRAAIEVRFVEEVFRTGYVTPIPKAPGCFVGMTNLRGRVIVLLDPAALLFANPPLKALPGRTAVLVSWSNIRAGLLVDQIEDVTAGQPDRFEAAAEESPKAGTIQTENGTIEVVHVERLLRRALAASAETGANLARQVAS